MRTLAGTRTGFQPRFGLAAHCHLTELADRHLLFSEATQKLMALNADAALLARILAHPASFDTLVDDLVACGIPRAAAADFLRPVLIAWSRDGLAEARPDSLPPPVHCQRIALPGADATIAYGTRGLAMRLAPMFRHLEGGQDASPPYHIHEFAGMALVGRADTPMKIARADQAGPLLKSLIVESAIAGPHCLAALHAACLIRGDTAMLLCGPPGTGKSVLTLALIDQGLGYGGDDIVTIHPSGEVSGLPFAITAKAGAWRRVRDRADYADTEKHMRLDDRAVRYLPPAAPIQKAPLPVGWIVELRRSSQGRARITARDPVAALQALVREGRSPSGVMTPAIFAPLRAIAASARCLTLHYSDADEAAALLAGLPRDE